MAMGPSRWKVITTSDFPWEQEAFDYLRSQLPDADPYLAWQGFNFISDNGSIYEVDVLILTPVGFFLVEVKSHPGVLSGDAASWTWKHEGRLQTVDNPLLLASSKSKKLAGLLKSQRAFKEVRCPFLEPLIFVSAPGLQIELPEHARTRICPRDRAATGDREGRLGVIAALTQGAIPGVDTCRTPRIDRAIMGCVGRGMEQAGIRQSEKYRLISDYRLKTLMMEGPGWQDWEGVHVSLPDNRRRIRRYTLATAASKDQRDMLIRAAKREYQVLDNLSHRGILAVKGFTDNEYGPALIFEHHPKAVRLDHYLADAGAKVGLEVRLSILRQVAESMKYAHGKGVFPHPQLAELLLACTKGRAARWATNDDVEAFLRHMYRQTPRRISSDTYDVSVNREGPYAGKKVRSAKLAGEDVPLRSDSWDDLVVAVCAKIARENPAEFKRVLQQITSTKNRCYFAEQPDPLRRWELVPGTEIYAEQNIAANNAASLCDALADLFGYWPKMEVETW